MQFFKVIGRRRGCASSWIGFAIWALSSGLTYAADPRLEEARGLYRGSDFSGARAILRSLSQTDPAVILLEGQCAYMGGDEKSAVALLQKAVAMDPASSQGHLWLARAYGRRAESANFLLAPMLAAKAHENFEAAVKLDPSDEDAANDLFEYYLEAPRFLGGGLDKAAALAERVRNTDPAEFQYDQARLAEKRGQPGEAERHYRKAAELSDNDAGRLVDLAEFLAAHGRHSESDQIFARARLVAPNSVRVLFETAKTDLEAHRNIAAARALLERYVTSRLTPDDPPRYEAARLLETLRR